MRPIAFFDVDRTLVDGYTGFETSLFLIRHGVFKKRRIAQALYYRAASLVHLTDVLRMYEIAIADMAGQPLARMQEFGRRIFDRSFAWRVFRDGIERVRMHQSHGHEIVLLSSGPYMTVDVLHERLGTDRCYSMGPAVNEQGVLLNEVRRPVCIDDRKLEVARAHASARGVPLSSCYFYTDSARDLALLREVGHPRVVNPERRLLREAVRRGWPVYEWRAWAPPVRARSARGE